MLEEFLERFKKIEEALNKAIPVDFDSTWQEDSFGTLQDNLSKQYIQTLIAPNKDLISLGGKRWRPLFLILLYEMYKKENPEKALSEEQAYSLTPLVEFVHTASLIHDDIEDSSDLRRGKPAAYITYGLDTALNCGSWLYFEAPVCINKADISESLKNDLYKLYTNELRRLHLGQAMDIYWHRNPSVFPSFEDYTQMVKCKTGTLASLAAQVGCIAGGATKEKAAEVSAIAANIGMGFQIIDDVINLTTGNPGKKRGDDIVEGKKSFPILIHTKAFPKDQKQIAKYMEQAAQEGIESPAVEACIELLQKSNCIKEAAELGKKLITENCEKLNSDLIKTLFTSMIPENFR